jgi:hypothetical protein
MRRILFALLLLVSAAAAQTKIDLTTQVKNTLPVVNGGQGCADSSTGNDSYAITLSPSPGSYAGYQLYCFKADVANTGPATLNVNALGAKTIKKAVGGVTTDLADNDIRAGQVVQVVYDGTNLQMQSTLGNAGSGSGNTTSTSLTTNKLPKANGANSIIDSSLSDDGSLISTPNPFQVLGPTQPMPQPGFDDQYGAGYFLGSPASGYCRRNFDLQSGHVVFVNASGGNCAPAMPFRVATDYCTTPGVYDSSCLSNAVANNTYVLVPARTYAFNSQWNFFGSHIAIELQQGAVLQANGSIGAIFSLFGGVATDVTLFGAGTIDCNSTTAVGVDLQASAGSDRVHVWGGADGPLEIKRCTDKGIVKYQAGDADVRRTYVHDIVNNGIQNIGNSGSLIVDDNLVTDITGANSQGIAGSDAGYFEAMRNQVYRVVGDCIYSLTADRSNVQQNKFKSCATGGVSTTGFMHLDTNGQATVADNIGETSGGRGYFVEVTPNLNMHGNDAHDTVAEPYLIGASAVAYSTWNTQLNALDVTTNLVAGTSITVAADSAVYSATCAASACGHAEGSAAITLTAGGAISSPAVLMYQATGVSNASYALNAPFEQIAIASNIALNYGQLQLVLSHSATCATADLTYPLPYIPANQWVFIGNVGGANAPVIPSEGLYAVGWNAFTGVSSGVVSWCVRLASGSLANTNKIWIDDYRINKSLKGGSVTNNKASMSQGTCFGLEMDGGEVANNSFSECGSASSTARFGYLFTFSPRVRFTGNECSFTAKTGTQASTCIYANDTSTFITARDTRSNADNLTGGTGSIIVADGPGVASITAASSAINTTETLLVKTPALDVNRLKVGTVIRVTLIGTCTSTVGNTSTFALRLGTAGTVSDGTIATGTVTAAASGTTIPFKVSYELTVRTIGTAGTGFATFTVENTGVTGVAAVNTTVVNATMSAFNTQTSGNILSATYKSAATTTTSTFQQAFIEVVQ